MKTRNPTLIWCRFLSGVEAMLDEDAGMVLMRGNYTAVIQRPVRSGCGSVIARRHAENWLCSSCEL